MQINVFNDAGYITIDRDWKGNENDDAQLCHWKKI